MKATQANRICSGHRLPAALVAVAMVLGVTLWVYAGKGGKPGGGSGSPPNPAIVYCDRGDNGRLWVMDVDGGNPTRLTEFPVAQGARWSPDGSKLVFQDTLDAVLGIYTMNADGSGIELVVSTPDGLRDSPDWTVAPDGGEWIAYCELALDDYRYSLYVVHPDGTDRQRLTWGEDFTHPRWSPGGDHILVQYGYEGDLMLLEVAHADGAVVVTGAVSLFGLIADAPGSPLAGAQGFGLSDWRHDGLLALRVSVAESAYDLWLLDPLWPALAVNLTESPERQNTMPAWSPDGGKLAFSGRFTKSPYALSIAVIDVETGAITPLTSAGRWDTHLYADWRPSP